MMGKHKLLFTIILSLCFSFSALAQNETTVSGQVTDASSNEPLPGVNIIIHGTDQGTSTDPDGQYEIDVSSLSDTLAFSFIGYERQIVPINGRTSIDIEMRVEILSGEEVVVVGYGTQEKETSTGSISSVSGDEIERAPVSNVSNSLGGKLPGLTMVNTSGEPGNDDATLRIRGTQTLNNNEPLIVIDGVPGRTGGLDRLNPRDIEDITVLKDASAAIYGSQAANGVILVTTKRGTQGPPQVSVNFNQGYNQPTRLPETADAPTYLTMLNEINLYRGNPPAYSEEEIQRYGEPSSDPWLYPNTNWYDEALKPFSQQTKGNLAVSGGSESIQYRLSFGGLTEDGFYVNSATRYNQYNFRSNIDGQFSDNVSLSFDVAGRWEDRNYPTESASGIFENLIQSFPHLPGFWPNGQPGPAIESGQNPVVMGSDATGFENDDRYYLQTNLQLEVQVPQVEGLSVRGMGAFDKDFRQVKRWVTPWMLYSFDRSAYQNQGGDATQYLSGAQRGHDDPELFQESEDGHDMMVNLIGEYQKDLEDHSYNILVGTEYQNFKNSFFNAFRSNYISAGIPQLSVGGEAEQDIFGSGSEGARLNFFSRLNYDYQNKYLVEVIGRYDGSYIFPEGDRFGFFPSFSLGWRLTEEDFFQDNIDFFDELKIRGSWGQTGNDRVDPYQYLATYGFSEGYIFNSNERAQSIEQSQTPNPDITWEVANQLDIGVEGEILDNRLTFEFDYFNYLRTDILTFRNASIPQSSGIELPRENIGEVKSWGYDGSITWRQNINNDLRYDITLNGGFSTNEIQYWDEPPGAPEWQQSTGAKMNTSLFYDAIGVFQDQEDVNSYPSWPGARPGDLIFRDVNEDGQITDADRIRVERNNIPDWTGGITLNTAYKQFDMSVFFQGAAGASQYIRTASGQFGNYYEKFADRRWKPDPDDPTGMSPDPNGAPYSGPRTFNRQEEYWMEHDNTYFFRKTDYLRLKTLEVGYNLPPRISTQAGIENMRIYANGFNLFTWTNYDLGDPEAAGDERGGRYPQKRIFNLGFSITF